MGTSLARDVKTRVLADRVIGVARSRQRAAEISALNIFDMVTESLEDALSGADMVILALPIEIMLEKISGELDVYFKNNVTDTVVTDIASVKGAVVDAVTRTSFSDRFVGSHPICGSEKSGAENSVDNMYDNSQCIITVSKNKAAQKKVKKFWEYMGCAVTVMTAAKHDKILAVTSHLPHALSFAYTESVDEKMTPFTAGSFSDMTRISGSDPDVWDGIFRHNSHEISRSVNRYISYMRKLKKKIDSGEPVRDYILQINQKLRRIYNDSSD